MISALHDTLCKPERSLSPQCIITISNPINSGIGMETLSGRRCSTLRLTINLTFHSASVATSQQIPCVPLSKSGLLPCVSECPPPPLLVYNLHTLQESKPVRTNDYNITNNSSGQVESTPGYEAAKERLEIK